MEVSKSNNISIKENDSKGDKEKKTNEAKSQVKDRIEENKKPKTKNGKKNEARDDNESSYEYRMGHMPLDELVKEKEKPETSKTTDENKKAELDMRIYELNDSVKSSKNKLESLEEKIEVYLKDINELKEINHRKADIELDCN